MPSPYHHPGTPFINPNAAPAGSAPQAPVRAMPNPGDHAGDIEELRMQQALAKRMRGGQHDLGAKMFGRVAVGPSWTQALSNVMQEGASAYMDKKNTQTAKKLKKEGDEIQSTLVEAMLTAPDDNSRMRVLGQAMSAGGTAEKVGMGLLTSMMKSNTTDWKLGEVYDDKGRKQKIFYNPKDPTSQMKIGGAELDGGQKPSTAKKKFDELMATGRYTEDQARAIAYSTHQLGQDAEGNSRLLAKFPGASRGRAAANPQPSSVKPVEAPGTPNDAVPVAGQPHAQALTPEAAQGVTVEDTAYKSLFDVGSIYGPPSPGQRVGPKAMKRLNDDKRNLRKELAANKVTGLIEAVDGLEAVLAPFEGKDLPGFGGILGIGSHTPNFMTSKEGKAVRASVAKVKNLILAQRSGLAVTDNELSRLNMELSQNALATDEDVRNGMDIARRYARRIALRYASDPLLRDVDPYVFKYHRKYNFGGEPAPDTGSKDEDTGVTTHPTGDDNGAPPVPKISEFFRDL